MFENKNAVNKVYVFCRIVRLRYQDNSSMAEHLNAFEGLLNQNTSLEVPLANEVLDLLLIGCIPNSWGTLLMTLGVSAPHGKQLTLDVLKSSFLNEEA